MTHKLLNTLSLLIFYILLGAVVISILSTRGYRANNKTVLEHTADDSYLLYYAQLHRWLNGEKNGGIIFIDLRDKADFQESHLSGSLNIPAQKILNRKYHTIFRKNKTKVLIAENQATAQAILMILLGKGYSDFRVLSGGYYKAQKHVINGFDPAYGFYSQDKAAWDYPRFMYGGASTPGSGQQPAGIPEKKEITAAPQGGC